MDRIDGNGRQRGDAAIARRLGRWWLGKLAALVATGCSPAGILNSLAWRRGIEITRSVGYGQGSRRTLDIYRPRDAAKAPVVVFFYGGSWQSGEKAMYLFVAAALARRGYVTMVPDYRLYPEIRYPEFIEDGALALQWAKANAARFGGDPERLFVMGHSAGAYIAAMLAIDAEWLKAVGLDPGQDIAGLIGISGPYDFLPLKDETLKMIFGGASRVETLPITYVAPGVPPALLATGTGDKTVDPGNSSRLGDRLRATGNAATVKTYAGVGHLEIIGTFAFPLRFAAPVLKDVDAFIAMTAASGRTPPRAQRAEALP